MIDKFRVILVWCLMGLGAGLAGISPALAQQENSSASIVDLNGGENDLPCGNRTITVARMQWPSSIVLAYIHAKILSQELGCNVEVIAGDMAATASSMVSTGEPAIAPELWVTRITQIWNSALESGRIRTEGVTFSSRAIEGWFLPPQLAARVPDLVHVEDLKDALLSLTNEPSGEEGQTDESGQVVETSTPVGTRVKFISCPSDWACSIINKNLIAAYGLQDVFDLVEPANRFEMDTLIAQSVSRNEMIVFYYWQPNAVLAQFDFLALDMGSFEGENFKCLAQRNCENPVPSSFPLEKAFIVAADWVAEQAPLVSHYLRRANMPLEEMNQVLNWQAQGTLTFEELAARFVLEREEIWRPWLAGSQ